MSVVKNSKITSLVASIIAFVIFGQTGPNVGNIQSIESVILVKSTPGLASVMTCLAKLKSNLYHELTKFTYLKNELPFGQLSRLFM
jgi:hypothetical protein